jgi:hypothetical protein
MPFTPYHFGPNGFVALLFRKWMDVPVFIAANVLIDIEVIADSGIPWYFKSAQPEWWFTGLAPGWPVHQLWHFHTLLIGGLAGAVFGALIYFFKPLRRLCERFMALVGLPGRATVWSMTLAGLLGACLHVLIDSFYHYDVQILWPQAVNPVFRWVTDNKWSNQNTVQHQVLLWCCIFWACMIGLYAVLLAKKLKSKTQSTR